METIKKSSFSAVISRISVILLFTVYPLLMTNKYYNIASSKYVFFCFVSAIGLMLCLLISVSKTNFSEPKIVIRQIKKQVTSSDIAALFFAAVSVISCLSSDYFIAALGGGQGRQMGLIMYISLIFAFFLISKFYIIRSIDFIPMGFAFATVCIFALIQFIGYDPFGLLATLTSARAKTFLTTIGNINVYASYISIIAPIAMYLFCFEKSKIKSVFWAITSSVGFIGLFTANSDSGYIGIGVAFILIFIMSAKSVASFKRIWLLILNFFVTAAVFKLISVIYADSMYHLTFLTEIATSTYAVCGGVIVSATVLYIMKEFNPTESVLKNIRKVFIITVILCFAVFFALIIYFSAINITADIGMFEQYFRFNDNWGTGRGEIWTKALKVYSELPLSKKLFGAGEDTFALLLTDKLGYSEIITGTVYQNNAHNEFIHHLLSVGLLGLISYAALAFFAIKSAIKSNSLIQRAMLIPVVSYLAQSFINILQPITSPFIFVLFALTQCKSESE